MYRGVIVPLITPLTADGEVCASSVERLIDSVRPSASGLLPALSSGEGWRLSPRQWRDMVTWTRRFAGGLPVMAGVQLPTTAEVVERGRLARQLEVEAVVVLPPFGKNLPQHMVRAHYQTVVRESGLPVLLYNEPKLAGTAIELPTLVELCRGGGVAGVKDSGGSAEVTNALVAAATGVPVFQGWEHLCLTTPGVQGYILPLSNLEASLCRAMFASPSPEGQEEMLRQCAAHDLLGDAWYAGIKRELQRRGIIADARVV